mgnify:CR=1 FL=1
MAYTVYTNSKSIRCVLLLCVNVDFNYVHSTGLFGVTVCLLFGFRTRVVVQQLSDIIVCPASSHCVTVRPPSSHCVTDVSPDEWWAFCDSSQHIYLLLSLHHSSHTTYITTKHSLYQQRGIHYMFPWIYSILNSPWQYWQLREWMVNMCQLEKTHHNV